MDRDVVEAVKTDVLVRGLDDWVDLAEVVSAALQARFGDAAREGYPNDLTVGPVDLARSRKEWLAHREREVLPVGVAAVKELLRGGFVRIGDVSGGFVPWPGSLDDIESQIDRAIQAAAVPLVPGDPFWIENTLSGNEAARKLTAA